MAVYPFYWSLVCDSIENLGQTGKRFCPINIEPAVTILETTKTSKLRDEVRMKA